MLEEEEGAWRKVRSCKTAKISIQVFAIFQIFQKKFLLSFAIPSQICIDNVESWFKSTMYIIAFMISPEVKLMGA